MMEQMPPLTAEEIEENFNRFRSLCEKLGDRSEFALALVDHFGERLALCPASGKKDYHRSTPGGLVEHSLRVLMNARTLTKAFGWQINKESLIIAALFHDIGKAGLTLDEGGDYYVPAETWRQEKLGELYTYSKDLPYMTTSDRSIYLLNKFGVQLSADEFRAIKLNDGFVVEENKSYCLKIPQLVFAIMTADYVSTMEEKNVPFWKIED
jgi:hypothetical protein